jgi:hypothetical protein
MCEDGREVANIRPLHVQAAERRKRCDERQVRHRSSRGENAYCEVEKVLCASLHLVEICAVSGPTRISRAILLCAVDRTSFSHGQGPNRQSHVAHVSYAQSRLVVEVASLKQPCRSHDF